MVLYGRRAGPLAACQKAMRRGLLAAGLASGLVAAAFGTAAYLQTGTALPAEGARVVVREGDSMSAIAARLRRAGVVRSALVFRLWARVRGLDRGLQPGQYRFAGTLRLTDVIEALAAGGERREVTIPEGLTAREVAHLLDQRGYGSAESFLCLAEDPEFLLAAGVPGAQLEGYLFPDTYRFSETVSAGEILGAMVRRFHERFGAAHHRRAAARGMSVNEIVTLASIIEKETAVTAERPLVAAVFHNRLRLGMPLQSDPTVIYATADFTGDLTRADLVRPSPYNTYVTIGLPPGPIANPGQAAIEAALAPADGPYLYFVSKNDGSHVFSVTLAEHSRAVARYQKSGPLVPTRQPRPRMTPQESVTPKAARAPARPRS